MKRKQTINRDWRKKVAWFNAIVIFLIPLIVFYKRIEITEELKMYFGNVEAIGDFFAYYKAKLLQFGAPTSLALTLYFKRKEGWKFKWDRYTILLALFSCSIILSTIMSEHKMVAIFGYPDRFEGAWTWLSYLMFSYSIYLFVESKEDIINTIKPFVYATGVASFIGVLQFVGFDLFNTSFGKWLILGPNYNALADSLVFKFPKGTVYTTLYNPNYIGTMVAMVVPLIVFLYDEFEDSVHKMVMVLIFVLNIIALIGSKSTGGLVGTSIVTLIMVIYFTWKSKHRVKIALTSLVMLVVLVSIAASTTLLEKPLSKFRLLSTINEPVEQVINDVQINGPSLKVVGINGEEINIRHDNKNIFVYDKDGELISDEMDYKGRFLKATIPYENWLVRYSVNENKLEVSYRTSIDNRFHSLFVHPIEDGYTIFGPQLSNDDLNIKKINLLKNERIMSRRGYMWNRSLPLLEGNILFGLGSDNFALWFPQNDIVAKANVIFGYNIIVDKVHNFLLNLAINFGLVGLGIFLYTVITSLINKKINVTMVLSVVGFLIAGLVNDSTVLLTYFIFLIISMSGIEIKENKSINRITNEL